jgi:hypothetical protein
MRHCADRLPRKPCPPAIADELRIAQYFRTELDEHREVIDRCAAALAAPFERLVEACAAAVPFVGSFKLGGGGGIKILKTTPRKVGVFLEMVGKGASAQLVAGGT